MPRLGVGPSVLDDAFPDFGYGADATGVDDLPGRVIPRRDPSRMPPGTQRPDSRPPTLPGDNRPRPAGPTNRAPGRHPSDPEPTEIEFV